MRLAMRSPCVAACCAAALLLVRPVRAVAQDTIRPPVVDARDAIWTATATIAAIALMQADSRIAHGLARPSLQRSGGVRTVAAGASLLNEKSLFAGALVGYGGARLAKSPRVARVAVHAAEAVLLSSAVATVVRGALGRSRPFVTNGDDAFDYRPGAGFRELRYRAFPSIHASSSFAAAAVLAGEVARLSPEAGRWVAPLAYGVAVLPGLGRMYKQKHWASDVLAGAFLGAETGRLVVRYHAARPDNWLDRRLIPTAGVNSVGVAVVGVRVAL